MESIALIDEEEIRTIYRLMLPRVYGYLFHGLGGRSQAAEDLTQEVFTAFVAAIRRGDRILDHQGWLISVARNKLVDHLRRAVRMPAPFRSWTVDDITVLEATIAAMQLLEALPPRQRIAMTLRYVDDLAITEVADLMGRSIAATESLLARARRTLAEVIT